MKPCSALCPFTACHACEWKSDMTPDQRRDALEDLVDDLFKMPEGRADGEDARHQA